MDAQLPDFSNPPVVEVALAVQFEPLSELQTPRIGLLWDREFRTRFPKIEEHAPLDPMMERFGIPGAPKPNIQFRMLRKPPVPRCWFLDEPGTELIQIQQDRFAHNWRRAGDVDANVEYPRYKQIRERFKTEMEQFAEFVAQEQLGRVQPNQCEVTYVNHIVAGDGWKKHGELEKILPLFRTTYTEEFLPELEEARVGGSYVISDSEAKPLGRLRFSIESAYRRTDDKPIMVLNLVARGRPDGDGFEGALSFLDIGHEWIVRGFAAITTPEMHSIWGRRQ